MRRRSLGLLLVAVLVVTVTASGLTAGLSPEVGPDSERYSVPPQGGEVDQVVMSVTLRPDGSAVWRMEHRIRLDDEAATQGFEGTRSRIETSREAFLANFTGRVRAMASTAERDTGRAMVVENVSVTAERERFPQEYGIIRYEFRWYGFAETEGSLRAGDALRGLFLDEETTLLVSWPDNVSLAEVAPEPDDRRDGAVVWDGPLEFASGEPAVVVESESLSFGPDLTWDASSGDLFLTLGVGAFLLLGLVGTGGIALRRWRRDDDTTDRLGAEDTPDGSETKDTPDESDADDTPDGSEADDTPDGSEADDTLGGSETKDIPDGPEAEDTSGTAQSGDAPDEETSIDDGDAVGGSGTGQGEETGSSPVDPEIPEELLSNEERVLVLLDERGGRLKQQDVVEALDWSETKTSEVVSDLREADRIEVYRIGRNNVLALPGTALYEPDDENGGTQP